MKKEDDRVRLLFGPYQPPALKVGDRATCLYRDAEVVIYDWSLGRIPWPLCYRAGTRAFGKGLLVNEDLARAIRRESAAAVQYWWGVCSKVVTLWRKALEVGRGDNPGTQRRIRAAVEAAAGAQRGRTFTPDQIEHRRQAFAKRNARTNDPSYLGAIWTEEELSMLGTRPDAEVAVLVGRTVEAVAIQRRKRGIAPFA
jgi:hypothetical protein